MTRSFARHFVAFAMLTIGATSSARAQSIDAHGFGDLGVTNFTARDSFNAVLGSSTGVVFGGGGGVVLPLQIFVDVRASRFKKNGKRVVAVNDEVFDLGISNTITITPLDVTGGYRFGQRRDRTRPYLGAGISWYRYTETDEFATTSTDAASATYSGFHLLGGAEVRVSKYMGIAGEIAWARVPDALGQEPSSVGSAFDETDLGGSTFRVKVVIGR